MNRVSRVAREALLWVGGVLGALCLLSLVAGWAFNVTPLVFSSGSMSPAYDAGALGIAREVPAADLAVGDVVSVVAADGDRVTHRVVAVAADGDGAVLTLRGDANDLPDAQAYPVASADRVLVGIPYAGYALHALASPAGLVLTGVFVVGLLLLGFGRGRRVVPVGLVGAVALGVGLGASGATPWAFTSAYWTDTATATANATAPAAATQAQPICAAAGQFGPRDQITLTWTNVDAAYEYYWEVRNLGGGLQSLGGGGATASSGTIGAAVVQGSSVVLTLRTTANGTFDADVYLFARLEGSATDIGSPTINKISRHGNSGLACGYN